jgi:hypothetical protein
LVQLTDLLLEEATPNYSLLTGHQFSDKGAFGYGLFVSLLIFFLSGSGSVSTAFPFSLEVIQFGYMLRANPGKQFY